jgi:hypothetical protein
MNAKEVLALIRERVHTGQPPSGSGDKTYGSKGSNTTCACCGRKIASHEIEYEVHFNSSRHAFSTHFYCYQIWWGEWRADGRRDAIDRSLGDAAEGAPKLARCEQSRFSESARS